MSQRHALDAVHRFTKAGDTYWRWYCACGVVGGRRASEAVARADHARHAAE